MGANAHTVTLSVTLNTDQITNNIISDVEAELHNLQDRTSDGDGTWPIAELATPLSIDLVREFHTQFGHPVAKNLNVGTAALRRLRVMLVLQELAELAQALGVACELEVKPVRMVSGEHDKKDVMNGMVKREWIAPVPMCYSDNLVDLVETADALGDLDYVVQGANLVFGIPAAEVMQEIHQSNMSKLGENGAPVRDEYGKIMKGPNFKQPDIVKILSQRKTERDDMQQFGTPDEEH